MSYCTKVRWFLSWDHDEKSKKFRLLVVDEGTEVIYYNVLGDDPEAIRSEVFKSNCKSKNPLIEANIQTRLEYFKHLPKFISEFKSHLQNMREMHRSWNIALELLNLIICNSCLELSHLR